MSYATSLIMKISTFLLQAALPMCLLAACSSTPTISTVTQQDNELTVIENWQQTTESESLYSDIWQRIVANYQLDSEIDNAQITAQLNWYKARQDYLDRVADRGVRYLHFITEQIEARNIPGELALLPIVESAFDPFAYSHGRASGVWQFIPATGRMFGLQHDWWHDGRRDIRKSTEAALSYLEGLQREFDGDWMLALAAYNSGPGTVRKAIRANRNQGKPTDFWSLQLPRETRDYVPKLIALAKLIEAPERYGVTLTPVPDEPYFAVINTGGQIDLALVAEFADTSIDEIYKLNPSFNRWATRPEGPHEVLVPIDSQDLINEQLAQLPKNERLKWQQYVVKSGDTLISIAQKYNTTPQQIIMNNDLNKNIIYPNQRLLIPNSLLGADKYSQSATQRLQRTVSARQPQNTQRTNYQVRSGDTLWGIAKKFNVSVNNLARWNGMAPRDPIHAGQQLVVWSKSAQTSPQSREVIRRVSYKVRSGDSLAGISQRFNVSLADVRRWNTSQANQKYLQPGQTLTLYVDVTR